MALSADRVLKKLLTPTRVQFAGPVAAGFAVYRGSIAAVCQDGTIVPAASANTPSPLVAVLGIAEHQQINTANFPGQGAFVGGTRPVNCLRGCYALPFDQAPTWANYGAAVYAIDDQTVTLTQQDANKNNRLQVGTLVGFDLDGTAYVNIA